MTESLRKRPIGLLLALLTAICASVAVWVFPKAIPTIALKHELTRETAIARARAFADARAIAVADARVAVRFERDGETQTFIELEAGGKPAVNAEVTRGDVALFSWIVRFFRPGDPREVRVTLAPDGRVIGFRRTLADADARPALDSAQAFALTDSVRSAWLGLDPAKWRAVSTSIETVQPSGRVDRTVTWERSDRTLGVAPLRLDVVVRGDVVGGARPYVKVPEPFLRRHAERRADNELYAQIALAFVPFVVLAGLVALVGGRKRRVVRWRPALVVGGVVGLALTLAQLNDIPGSWFDYETASSVASHVASQWLEALGGGLATALFIAVLLATGELLTREAFPEHFDWWQTERFAGTRPVALRVLSGYTLAAFGLAYVSVFYLVVERGLGWWSPSDLLDDPNLIATPFPWISAVANSLQAGVLEEVLFRAIPIALVARAVGHRPWRPFALAAASIVTALVFGFAHADYPSWPAYARGVELFVEATLWAFIYIRFGLVTTVVAHFLYDLFLFGLFAASGNAAPYRVTLFMIVLFVLTPALMVLRRAWASRGLVADAPDEARFAAWRSASRTVTAELPIAVSTTARRAGPVITAMAVTSIVLMLWPTTRPAEPRFSANRTQAITTADSVLTSLGDSPDRWTRLVDAGTSSWSKERRFLTEVDSSRQLTDQIAHYWLHPGGWSVRYVHLTGTVAERTESWRIEVTGDGRPHIWSHVIADSAPAPTLARSLAEDAARAALVAGGARSQSLVLLSAKVAARPARRDVLFEFQDTSVTLPANASLRRLAVVSGDRVTRITHRLFVPEVWERADRARVSARSTLTLAIRLALGLSVLVGLVVYWRRKPLLEPMQWPSRARMIVLAVVCGALLMLLRVNNWSAAMHAWNTTSPFNRHQWTSALSILGAGLLPAIVWGLWTAADAIRRRAAVSVRSPSARDAWLIGAALALGPGLSRVLSATVGQSTPSAVDTSMDRAVPLVAELAQVGTALALLPVCALAAGAALSIRSARLRIVAIVVAAIAGGVMGASSGAVFSSAWLSDAATGALGFGLTALIVWRLGRSSLEAWFVAVVVVAVGMQLRGAMLVSTGVDRSALLLSAVISIAATATIIARRSAAPASAPVIAPRSVSPASAPT